MSHMLEWLLQGKRETSRQNVRLCKAYRTRDGQNACCDALECVPAPIIARLTKATVVQGAGKLIFFKVATHSGVQHT